MSFSSSFFEKNRNNLFGQMKAASLALFFQANPAKKGDEVYLEICDPNFFYLTGIKESQSRILLFKDKNGNCTSHLFLKKSDEKMLLFHGKGLDKEGAKKISGIDAVFFLEEFDAFFEEKIKETEYCYFFEEEEYDSQLYDYKIFIKKLKEKEKEKQYLNSEIFLRDLRLKKSDEEIEAMKGALRITHKAFLKLMEELTFAHQESDLKALLDYEVAKAQTQHAYTPIVASGERTCILHYPHANQKIAQDDLILVDFGAEFECYASDITRTFPKSGTFNERQKAVYESCLKIQEEAFRLIKVGKSVREYEKELRRGIVAQELLKLGMLEEKDFEDETILFSKVSQYYPHLTSHFLGLDVHDLGSKNLDTLIAPRQVLTVEPGLYFPLEKIGVRIEDNVLVTEEGIEVLSKDIPKSLEIVEKLIND